MRKLIVRIEHAALHPGVAVLFIGKTNEALAQTLSATVAGLLEGRMSAFYWATVDDGGAIKLGEEVPISEVPEPEPTE
jgi:hypothetical protein